MTRALVFLTKPLLQHFQEKAELQGGKKVILIFSFVSIQQSPNSCSKFHLWKSKQARKAPVNSSVVEIVSGRREMGPVTIATFAQGEKTKTHPLCCRINRAS